MVQEPAAADRPQRARRSARSPEAKPTRNGQSKGQSDSPPHTVPYLGGEAEPPEPHEALARLEETERPGSLLDPEKGKPTHLATARFRIALFSMGILAFVVVGSFASLWRAQPNFDDLARLLEILFAPLVALAGVAVAFYYKSQPPP
jgi:hypothetical protein